MGIKILKFILLIWGFFQGNRCNHSWDVEDNFRYMDWREKLWWGYKALVKQVEEAEPGKKIESYFANQNLEFKTGETFQAESDLQITAGGDLSCSEVVYPESTRYLWDDIAGFYFGGDLVYANLEAPLDPSKPAGVVPSVCLTAPGLNMTEEMFERFSNNSKGVNLFSTANNHSLDQGEAGIIATLDFLDAKGYPHVGTARTPEEQGDIPVIEKNGIRIAFLAYTYCLNRYEPIPGKEYMTNMIRLNKPDVDISMIQEHVKIARQKKADLIVALLHWSVEFETYPIENVIQTGHRIMESGVDIILGGHPHVAQPMEKYCFRDPYDGRNKEGFIIYSLGELVSYNAFSKNSRLALVVGIDLAKGRENRMESVKITGIKVLPVYTWVRHFKNGSHDYRLLDFRKTLKMLAEGMNPYGFSKKEIKELYRLEALLYDKLLPKNNSDLLV